jgi:exodeoxyribonuclease-3
LEYQLGSPPGASLLARFLREHQPDVVALQETKVENGLFPGAPFAKLGYVHQAINGQKGYHGVAVLSKIPFRKRPSTNTAARAMPGTCGVTLENGVEVNNFYVPAGADVPDADINPKFGHKLDFLREMDRKFASRGDRHTAPAILVGDLNVAPLEHDVWSHKQLLDVVSHTPVETNLLGEAKAAFEWTDVTREFVPHDEKSYSWWSYRAADWLAEQPRPPPRPHLDQPGTKGWAEVTGDHHQNAWLAERERSCAGAGGGGGLGRGHLSPLPSPRCARLAGDDSVS